MGKHIVGGPPWAFLQSTEYELVGQADVQGGER